MKLMRPRTFVIFSLVAISGAVLLHTSQNVQHAEEKLAALELAKYREQEKIRMLRAEWENLNRPERLEKLANEFLDLVPPTPEQIADDDVMLPDPVREEFEADEQYAPVLQNVSFELQEESTSKVSAPIPQHKPSRAPVRKPSQPSKQKAFGDLIDELGGAQ